MATYRVRPSKPVAIFGARLGMDVTKQSFSCCPVIRHQFKDGR